MHGSSLPAPLPRRYADAYRHLLAAAQDPATLGTAATPATSRQQLTSQPEPTTE